LVGSPAVIYSCRPTALAMRVEAAVSLAVGHAVCASAARRTMRTDWSCWVVVARDSVF